MKRKIEYRAYEAYDTKQASDDAAIPADQQGESTTIQSMTEDSDINVLMKRYGLLGQLPPQGVRLPEFGDFNGITNYQDALNAIDQADQNFNSMPAELRARFKNSPQLFLEFVTNPNNLPEMRKLGLAKPDLNVKAETQSPTAKTPPAPPAPPLT